MPNLLTYREAADALSVSQPTLRRMVADGTFRTIDMARPNTKRPAPRFREEDVQEYLSLMARRVTQS